MLTKSLINTPLGSMIAISNEKSLFMLQFADQKNIDKTIHTVALHLQTTVTNGTNKPIQSITEELNAYFYGTLQTFKTPIKCIGTSFQKDVWQALTTIPFGKTCNYQQLAIQIQNKRAHRAVANANAANPLAIIIPCHRVIRKNNVLGGYAGRLERKKWLLEHEAKLLNQPQN